MIERRTSLATTNPFLQKDPSLHNVQANLLQNIFLSLHFPSRSFNLFNIIGFHTTIFLFPIIVTGITDPVFGRQISSSFIPKSASF